MLKNTNIQAGSDEFIVKTYHASKFRSQVSSVTSDGYLYITNQRVIFRAIASDSVIHSEIPIDNVSGINLYHGAYRDWMSLIIFLIISFPIAGAILGLVGTVSFIDSSGSNLIGWGIGLMSLALAVASNNRISDAVFFSDPAIRMSLLLQGIISTISFASFLALSRNTPIALIFVIATFYLVITAVLAIPRRYSMSLAIISKGGSSTPIMLAGANSNGMVFSAAAQALEAEPGNDATQLIQELGAVIHDIQTLGTLGVERWMDKTKWSA
jgi:uncharacterized protein (DUF486 family)